MQSPPRHTQSWRCKVLHSSWNVMAHGDAQEGKWRRNRRMQWVASTLHTTSEHGVSSITIADAHTSAASSRPNWRPRWFKCTRPFRRKTKSSFRACAVTFQLASTNLHRAALSTRNCVLWYWMKRFTVGLVTVVCRRGDTASALHGVLSKGCRQYPGRKWEFSGGWQKCNLVIFHSTYDKQKTYVSVTTVTTGCLWVTEIEDVTSQAIP